MGPLNSETCRVDDRVHHLVGSRRMTADQNRKMERNDMIHSKYIFGRIKSENTENHTREPEKMNIIS